MGGRKVLHNLKRAIALAESQNQTDHELGCDLIEGYLYANRENPKVYKLILELYMILCKERNND